MSARKHIRLPPPYRALAVARGGEEHALVIGCDARIVARGRHESYTVASTHSTRTANVMRDLCAALLNESPAAAAEKRGQAAETRERAAKLLAEADALDAEAARIDAAVKAEDFAAVARLAKVMARVAPPAKKAA